MTTAGGAWSSPERVLIRRAREGAAGLVFVPGLEPELWQLDLRSVDTLVDAARGESVDTKRAEELARVGLLRAAADDARSPQIVDRGGGSVPLGREALSAPLRFELDLTDRCNLACRHCRANADGSGAHMPTHLALRLLREAADLGVFWLVLGGGEPLLHPDIFEIVGFARTVSPWHVALTTNGTVGVADRLASEGQLDELVISLDGLRGVHEALRGLRTYERTLRGVCSAVGLGAAVTVKTLVTPENAGQLGALGQVVADTGAAVWALSPAFGAGRAVDNSDLHLSTAQLVSVGQEVRRLGKSLGLRVQWNAFSPCAGNGTVGPFRDVMSGCGAGRWICYVDSAGQVAGCKMLPNQIEGDVREAALGDVWGWPNAYDWFERRRDTLSVGECRSCELSRHCAGGCPAMAPPPSQHHRDRRCL